jgi:cobalt/nickel transport system ATP-binding protein
MNPEILVIDEPTANLDPGSKWSLIELLGGLEMTKVIATHDLELVKALCPRTVVFDHGKVIIDGATSRILADKKLLSAHGLASPL